MLHKCVIERKVFTIMNMLGQFQKFCLNTLYFINYKLNFCYNVTKTDIYYIQDDLWRNDENILSYI